jgi:hypothetical protein
VSLKPSGSIEPDLDWTFRIGGLTGPTRFGLARAPQSGWLKEVRIDRWFKGSSLVRTTTSRSDGTFVLPSLAPGDYPVVAAEFSELDPNADDLLQPETLTRLASSAQRVTVAERQQQRVDLKLAAIAR